MKANRGDFVADLKACVVAKGMLKHMTIDYSNTLCMVAKLVSICLFISLMTTYVWPLQDIKDTFLYSDLQDEIYM